MADDALIRKKNLIRLGKNSRELVTILGRTYSYWQGLMHDPKKSFGEKIAREIEGRWGLPRLWLDDVHDDREPIPEPALQGGARTGQRLKPLSESAMLLARRLDELSEPRRARAVALIDHTLRTFEEEEA